MARQAAFSLSRGFYEGRVCLYQPEEPLEVQDVRMRTWRAKISAIRVQLYQLTGAALQQLLDTHPQVLREPEEPIVRVKEQADSAIVLLARFWCANADYWNLQYDLLQQVKLTFDDKGISIPFPQMDVHVK